MYPTSSLRSSLCMVAAAFDVGRVRHVPRGRAMRLRVSMPCRNPALSASARRVTTSPSVSRRRTQATRGSTSTSVTAFSNSLNAKPEWIKTTWANLLPDLTAGKCDIAVGGVSVTTDRQKRAFFSVPYMVNGKTPIARCADVSKYQTIDQIDRPEVRVIFNPGGSNERFARTNFKQAKLTLHGENVTIFDEILANRADVFVTEAAEAITQQKLKPGLCAINPDKPLQYGEMAWMLPRDDVAFKSYVDQWLHLSVAGGEFQRVTDHWLR